MDSIEFSPKTRLSRFRANYSEMVVTEDNYILTISLNTVNNTLKIKAELINLSYEIFL